MRDGSVLEVLATFLKLGVSAFGGPVAHLGYFRRELVLRRGWLDEAAYADLVALCQFLPGPASSQVGFALGIARGGGLLGGLAAWAGFTLPSALLLVLFALFAQRLGGPIESGVIHGLKLVAVAVVAQAVWGMARNLAPDRTRAAIALVALAFTVVLAGTWGQVTAIAAGGVAGLLFCRQGAPAGTGQLVFPVSRRTASACLAGFLALLVVPTLLQPLVRLHALDVFDAFYRSGALVFGGGHVVLPLLQAQIVRPGWVSPQAFLAGYGATQAVPGPLFTFAAYLGAAMQPGLAGVGWAAVGLVAIFLPGLLLITGMLPFWDALRRYARAQAAMRGINAAVVGLLTAALYSPVWTSAIGGRLDFLLAAGAFVALTMFKAPAWLVVALTVLAAAIV